MLPAADRIVAEVSPVAAGTVGFLASYQDWWELANRSYSVAIGAFTLAYVAFRAANEFRKWRGKAGSEGDQ